MVPSITFFPIFPFFLRSNPPPSPTLSLMAALVAGGHSDPYLSDDDLSNPSSSEDNNAIDHYMNTSNTQSTDPDDPSSSKRRKSKPVRFGMFGADIQNENRAPKLKLVVRKTSGKLLSMKRLRSKAKALKAPVPPSPAMIRAEEFQASLGTDFPSCVKVMVRTQVCYGFWMGLPLPFCRSFMPKEDVIFTLEDVNGGQWEVKYLAQKNVLSAGWKVFVVAHNLIEGDVLVFHLIEPLKFKIYILKQSESNELVDGALGLLHLDPQDEEMNLVTPIPKPKKRKNPFTLEKKKNHKKPTPSPEPIMSATEVLEHSGTNSESEILEPSMLPHNLKSFENFQIIVNGQSIDSELPPQVKLTYYKLCLHKKQTLHDSIRGSLYHKLIAGMIGETVNIAREVKNCKLTISKEELEAWDNSLMSFEILGMEVGFLREKVRRILRLVFESGFGGDVRRYVEAKKEEKVMEEDILRVRAKLLELKMKLTNFGGVLGELKDKAEKYMIEFRDEVDVPW
ncbi:hypothetical protein LXL04_006853 [Taraxacum kok-saghyz]